jgi:hypothetical protein
MAASQVPTPGGTPAGGNPYSTPDEEGTRGVGGQESDRSLGVGGGSSALNGT